MVQAAEPSTTRRAVLLGLAATVPATNVLAFPQTPAIDPALADDLRHAFAKIIAADRVVADAERIIADWCVANPEPDYDDTERPRGRWVQTHIAIMKASGIGAARYALNQALREHTAACESISVVQARTMADLLEKAHLAEFDDGQRIIAQSIVWDILSLQEGA